MTATKWETPTATDAIIEMIREGSLAVVLDCLREACSTIGDENGPQQAQWEEAYVKADEFACWAEDVGLRVDASGVKR